MTYWNYTFRSVENNKLSYGYGIVPSQKDEFDFVSFYKAYPHNTIICVNQISEEQYNEFKKLLQERIEEEN